MQIRTLSTSDGRVTVFIGDAVVVTDLSEAQAAAMVAAYRRVAEAQ